jgi:hypothetical protein
VRERQELAPVAPWLRLAIVFPAWTAATSSWLLLKEMQITMSLLARCSTFTALALIAVTAVASAQTPATTPAPAATHKHYDVSAHAAMPGPDGELAPRLQNLGHAHVSGHDESS